MSSSRLIGRQLLDHRRNHNHRALGFFQDTCHHAPAEEVIECAVSMRAEKNIGGIFRFCEVENFIHGGSYDGVTGCGGGSETAGQLIQAFLDGLLIRQILLYGSSKHVHGGPDGDVRGDRLNDMKKDDPGIQRFCQCSGVLENGVGGFAEVEGHEKRFHFVTLGFFGGFCQI